MEKLSYLSSYTLHLVESFLFEKQALQITDDFGQDSGLAIILSFIIYKVELEDLSL